MLCVLYQNLVIVLTLNIYSVTTETSFPHPVGLWMFNKQHEGKDLSGNGNDAVLYDVAWHSGPYGLPDNSVYFTGAGDESSRAEISNTNRALSVGRSMTWITYVKDMDPDGEGPLLHFGPKSSLVWVFWNCCSTGSTFAFLASGTAGIFDGFFPSDEWVQIAVMYDYDQSKIKVYKNGEELVDERLDFTSELDDEHDQIYIGVVPGDSRLFEGEVYCMMYFDAALTREQLSAATSICRTNELIALYPWPYAVATWPMNSKFGKENAADGIHMDGTANYYSVEKGPDGAGAYLFRNSISSYARIENIDNRLDVISFTLTAWIKPSARSSVIFRIWGDSDDTTESISIWKTGDGTQLSYSHYSNDTGDHETTIETSSGALILDKWNFIAVSYDYAEGKSYIYSNGELQDEGAHGSHVTKMGPIFAFLDGSTNETQESSSLSCVSWFDTPLSLMALEKVKSHCTNFQANYKPSPALLYPFNSAYQLDDTSNKRMLATSSHNATFVAGARKRPNEALEMAAGQNISFPDISDSTQDLSQLSSWTLSFFVKSQPGIVMTLIRGVLGIDNNRMKLSDNEIWSLSNYSTIVYPAGEFVWLGSVYDGYNGIWIIYMGGSPIITKYVGPMTIDARSLSIENTGPATAVQCYQFYTEALDQIQFSRIRDACLAYNSDTSLPYPRGFWPLNDYYQLRDITERSGDFTPYPSDSPAFDVTGPYGDANGGLSLTQENNLTTLYIQAAKSALDVKFSFTVALWIKVHSTFPMDARAALCYYDYIHKSEYQTWNDRRVAGVQMHFKRGDSDNLSLAFKNRQTNSKVNKPEISDFISTNHMGNETADFIPYDTWVHIAVTVDFAAKELVWYADGLRIYSARLNRYISKTFFSLQVGIPLILDDDVPLEESLSGDSLFNNSFSISCYQLYDVTLTQGQIERAMDLCRADVLGSYYHKHDSVPISNSFSSPSEELSAGSRTECLQHCATEFSCQSAAFGDDDNMCEIDSRTAADNSAEFSDTGMDYMEKVQSPWRLFV